MQIGVVGAGIMGRAIAAELASRQHAVVLVDNSAEVLAQAPEQISELRRMQTLLSARSEGNVSEEDDVLRRIQFTSQYEDLAEVGVLVENIVEDRSEKRRLYKTLDRTCTPSTVFVVNSSTMLIEEVAGWTSRPDKVIGIHFMNPVGLIGTAEVVTWSGASASTLASAHELLTAMGKTGLVVKDSPGYVSNRVYMLTVNEAILCVEGGLAPAEVVDQMFQQCFGWKAGPLATADLIGLDTVCLSLRSLHEYLKEEKFRPAALLLKMVAEGRIGCKSGSGFYEYYG